MRFIQLTPRLRAVANMVPAGARLADVGTDHAYLPACLLQEGVLQRAVVSDLRRGPLDRARATAERYSLTERMDFRLCDGLSGIDPDEVDAIVIAGMGGETIAAILEAAPWTVKGEYLLLLQPMTMQHILRPWLQGHGFRITDERLVCEGDSIYTIIQARPGTMKPLTPVQCWAGRQSQDPLRGEYLGRLLEHTGRALAGLSRSVQPGALTRRQELETVRAGLEQQLEEWKQWQP